MRDQYKKLAALGLDVRGIMRLTPRQKREIYGEEEQPIAPAMDAHARVAQLLAMVQAGMVKATPEQLKELERRLASGPRTGAPPS